jgi:hypothetical protein
MEGLNRADGVTQAYQAALEPFWHPVAPADSLADGPVAVTLLGRGLALARLDGEAPPRCTSPRRP